jgi:hypothetical protein
LLSYLWKLVRVVLKGETGSWVGEWGKQYGGCRVLWPLCVLGCISVLIVEGACVRDCRALGLCKVGTWISQQVVSV